MKEAAMNTILNWQTNQTLIEISERCSRKANGLRLAGEAAQDGINSHPANAALIEQANALDNLGALLRQLIGA